MLIHFLLFRAQLSENMFAKERRKIGDSRRLASFHSSSCPVGRLLRRLLVKIRGNHSKSQVDCRATLVATKQTSQVAPSLTHRHMW
jgi:hypothetical protein